MQQRPDTTDFKQLFLNDTPLLDTRAPTEFDKGAFPHAINLPLMSDDERHQIGLCYKQRGQKAAIALGHKLVSGAERKRRIQLWSDFAKRHPQGYLYCFRGGLRSQTVQHWLAQEGIDYPLITGGYKAMRQFLLQELARTISETELVLISGTTGTGKTRVIEALNNSVDLEGLAHHRGSTFGHLLIPQPSQINFENTLSIALMKQLASGFSRIYLEDEGRMIGSLSLPEPLRDAMSVAPMLVIEESLDSRADVLVEDYIIDLGQRFARRYPEDGSRRHRDTLHNALARVRKRLGGERYLSISADLDTGFKEQQQHNSLRAHHYWIRRLLEEYYDPMYHYQMSRREGKVIAQDNRAAIVDIARRTC